MSVCTFTYIYIYRYTYDVCCTILYMIFDMYMHEREGEKERANLGGVEKYCSEHSSDKALVQIAGWMCSLSSPPTLSLQARPVTNQANKSQQQNGSQAVLHRSA